MREHAFPGIQAISPLRLIGEQKKVGHIGAARAAGCLLTDIMIAQQFQHGNDDGVLACRFIGVRLMRKGGNNLPQPVENGIVIL